MRGSELSSVAAALGIKAAIIKSQLHEKCQKIVDVFASESRKAKCSKLPWEICSRETLLKAKPNLSGLLCMWPHFEVGEKEAAAAIQGFQETTLIHFSTNNTKQIVQIQGNSEK